MKARRRKVILALAWATGAIALRPRAFAESSRPKPTTPDSVANLIEHLGDPGPRQRSAASEKLRTSTAVGLRDALLDSAHHATNPEIRERAARLLCDMPWSKPSDTKIVEQALGYYRTSNIDKRIEALGRLGAIGSVAVPALLRLLEEEPSDDVRWAIVGQLRSTDAAAEAARGLKPSLEDAPALAAAGWGWQPIDPERASSLFHRAVYLATTQPADDHGEIDLILTLLRTRAINHADFADAIDLYRRHMWFGEIPIDQEAANLFALHARYWPQPGLDADLRTFGRFFTQPEMVYTLGKLYAARGDRLSAAACYSAAFAASVGGTADVRSRVGGFLLGQQWFDLARVEFLQSLDAPSDNPLVRDMVVYFSLARCDDAIDDQLQAAADMDRAEKALRTLPANNPEALALAAQYAAIADWHRLRDAVHKGDRNRIEQLATKLLANGGWPTRENPLVDVDIDLVRAFKSLGRKPEADKVFKEAYSLMRLRYDKAPHDPETLNNLAWLCARAGERLDESYRWAKEAVKLAPANAAYLDTFAEAASALGKWDEAVAAETTALKIQPGDNFMTGQLARFKAKAN